jgi:hypothetical protein
MNLQTLANEKSERVCQMEKGLDESRKQLLNFLRQLPIMSHSYGNYCGGEMRITISGKGWSQYRVRG